MFDFPFFFFLYALLGFLRAAFPLSSFSPAPYVFHNHLAFFCLRSGLGLVASSIFHSAWLSQRMYPFYIICPHTNTRALAHECPYRLNQSFAYLLLPNTTPDLMKKHERCSKEAKADGVD